MLDKLDARPSVAMQPALSWPQIWLTAVARPTPAAYQDLMKHLAISPRTAYLWLLGSSFISGLLVAAAAFFRGSEMALGTNLALAVPLFALIHTLACAIFAGCVHGIVHLLRGSGSYQELIKVFAALSVPLVLLAGLLALAPRTIFLMMGLYLYWLLLYSIAIQVVYSVSRAKAVSTMLTSLLLLGGALLGLGFLLIT